jgi:hypothetical protein
MTGYRQVSELLMVLLYFSDTWTINEYHRLPGSYQNLARVDEGSDECTYESSPDPSSLLTGRLVTKV